VAKDKRASVFFDRIKMQFIGLDEALLEQVKETYKNIDVENELKKMGLWLLSPKGKLRKGNIGFIMNWLNNAIPSIRKLEDDHLETDSPLTPFLREYRKELWKDREHILAMNRRKS